jgi:hypothetical protein
LLKQIGVIALRGAKTGVDEKVVELAKLFHFCGCDFFALRKLLDELGVSPRKTQKSKSSRSHRSASVDSATTSGVSSGYAAAVPPLRASFISYRVLLSVCRLYTPPTSSTTSQDLNELMNGLDSLLEALLKIDYDESLGDEQDISHDNDALSHDELKHSLNSMMKSGAGLRALIADADLSERVGRRSTSMVVNTPPPVLNIGGISSLRLLCARIAFIGHMKHNLWRIILNIRNNKIEVDSAEDLYDMSDDRDKDDDGPRNESDTDESRGLPFVPLSSDGRFMRS